MNERSEGEPRPAATVILLRDGDAGLEACLARRNLEARFMPGVWVFPGGAVDSGDGPSAEAAHRSCAVRELAEEVGIEVAESTLVAFSRWITPREVPVRFDTRFYLAPAPTDAEPMPDGSEVIDAGWFGPAAALERHGAGELELVFPTIKHLEALVDLSSVEEALGAAEAVEVRPVEPRLEVEGEEVRVVIDPIDSDQPGTHRSAVDQAPPPGEA